MTGDIKAQVIAIIAEQVQICIILLEHHTIEIAIQIIISPAANHQIPCGNKSRRLRPHKAHFFGDVGKHVIIIAQQMEIFIMPSITCIC